MISPELIVAHSKYLAAQRGDQHFLPECRRLMDAVKDGVISAFSTEIASGVVIRVVVNAKEQPLWQLLEYTFDSNSAPMFCEHGIEFKKSLPSSLMHIPVVGTTWHSCLAWQH
jgi:hypothetical protein